MNIGGHYAAGEAVVDDMQLSAILLRNMTLSDVNYFDGESIAYLMLADSCDGVIGLAPPNSTALSFRDTRYGHTSKPHPNLMYSLVNSQTLDENVMTISLPKTQDQKGKIVLAKRAPNIGFGIPLVNGSASYSLENRWNVKLDSVTLEGPVPLLLAMQDVLMTVNGDLSLQLPKEAAKDIYEYFGAKQTEDGA